MNTDEYEAYKKGVRTAKSIVRRLQLGVGYLFIFFVIVLAYLVHTYNQREYDRCVRGQVNTRSINTTNSAIQTYLAALQGKAKDPAEFAALVRIFSQAQLVVPDCGDRPWF